ncbi:MAG: TonB-dependent receptor [Halioglobus sp.]
MRSRSISVAFTGAFVLAVTTGGATTSAVANEPSGEAGIQEQIIVTASRNPEDGRNLPLAWAAATGDDLSTVSAVHLNEVMQRIPGTWISRGNGQESLIALRSPVLTGAGSCGAFFTASDGISLRAPGFCNVNQLFDANFEQAARIEVIKGPATALYGSNAMHGVINVISAAPTQEQQQRIGLEIGPDEFYRLQYSYSNTRGKHGVRISANGGSDDGYKDDSGYDQQKATLRHDYAGDVWQIQTVLEASNLNQETAGFIQGFEAYKDNTLRDTNPNPEAYRDASSLRFYSRASRALDASTTLVITPYFRDNEMEFLQHFLPWQPVEENAHSSIGLKTALQTSLQNLNWINGVDIERTDATLSEVQAQPFSDNQPAGVHYDYQVDASVIAAYTQLRTAFDSKWELSGGLRIEQTRYDYDNRTGDGSACGPDASNCRFFRPSDRDDTFENFSANAGASYAWNEQHLAYLRVARGFRAPQATELYRLQAGQENADLDSEQIDNVEIGFRGASQGVSYDLSFYYMEKDDVIFQDADRQNISGASTEHTGAEINLNYSISDIWRVAVDATVARHRYDSQINLIGSSGEIKGNDIDTAPRVFGSARVTRDLRDLTSRDSYAELEWVYLDEYYLEPDNEHEYDGHSLLNLRIGGDITRGLSAAMRLTNLLDEKYAERADFGFGQYRYFVGQPRGAYFELAYRFGVGTP